MVTKVHLKQKWLPQSPMPGSSKSSKNQTFTTTFINSPRTSLKKVGIASQPSLKSSSVSFSLSTKSSPCKGPSHGNEFEDIVLGGWIKRKNPRRALDYDLYGYHCWVSQAFST
jgi:hypothetical protein